MDLDSLLISRLQFAFTIIFHIMFPAFTIGLSAYIATLCVLWMRTGKEHYRELARFWTKIFAAAFAMGVVSGIVLSYQFGTNWSRYSAVLGNVVGPMIAYEVEVAFFLEATFLGVLLFGWERMPPWLHTLSAIAVAGGTLLSAFWILSANSWMQTPVGYEIVDGRFFPKDWLQIIFNPSFPYRLAHTVVAFYVTTGFVVVGVAAFYLRRGRFVEEARSMLSVTLWLLTIAVPLQIFLGDRHGLNSLQYQPAKVAAIEARWDSVGAAPLTLSAVPDEANERTRYAVDPPSLGSMILTHDVHGNVRGLKEWAPEERPPVAITFFAFRVMVGIGLLMLALVIVSWWMRAGRRLYDSVWFLRCCQAATPLGFIAVLAGWTTTEVGRQPWTVFGIMRTADSVSPSLTGQDVLISLIGYAIVYLIIFPFGLVLMGRLVRIGPLGIGLQPEPVESGRPDLP